MKIIDLECKNFRNLKDIKIFPCENMNVICGENAQGKTNLIEAIWLFTGAKSFRTSKDADFLQFKKEKAVLNLSFISENIENNAVITITNKRSAQFNNKKLDSASLLAGKFNAIVFSPADLALVADGPSIRRRFLDTAIGQIYPSYINILKNYVRAVTQRNKIIKDYKYDSTLSVMLDVFEEEISENGKKINEYRQNYIKELNEFLSTVYDGISAGREVLSTKYISSFSGDFLNALKEARKEDMYLGVTSIGPHRDDIDFKINGISARKYGSQGQKRSVALAVKLAEAEVLKKKTGECPIILLDDVMSELDINRQNYILNHIEGMQSFITCCEDQVVKNLIGGKKFIIKDGSVL